VGDLVSIVVCTRNRAADLRETLLSLAQVDRPDGVPLEILVIDNGSTDGTQAMLKELDVEGLRTVVEPIAGVARARNAGIQNAQGDPVIFIDDDLRFPKDWLIALLDEFEKGADALAGALRLAPHLERPWMTAKHREMLGSTELYEQSGNVGLHGGTMAFRRYVFDKVPAFDNELGVGALGSNEELLFADQLLEAGFKIGKSAASPAEHHCSLSLIRHENLVRRAYNMGRSAAYIAYHWAHDEAPIGKVQAKRAWLGYLKRKLKTGKRGEDGIESFEVDYHVGRGYGDQLRIEMKRPRNYAKRGLRRL